LPAVLACLDQRFDVDTVWLYGSASRGELRAGSDVDLAMLVRRHPTADELYEARSEAAELIGRDVDLVDLDRASPILAMQVLRHGRLLVDRDPARRWRFEAAVPGRYEDLMIMRRPMEKELIQRVLHGRT
jgi:uncharacterized protein